MSNQLNTIEVQSTDLVFQQDKALIDIQIATAKAYPRNVKLSLENAIMPYQEEVKVFLGQVSILPRS
jgi:hypothetical protein